MSNYGWIFLFSVLICAVLFALWNQHRTRKTLNEIDQMLDRAINESFTEDCFDESRLSALETKFAHYLSAAAISAKKVSAEKDKIHTLISDISHQTKTLISNLLLYCELLKEEALPESAKDNAEAIHVQAEKLRFLIDALVKLSRLENGIITLSPHQQAIQPILKRVIRQFESSAKAKGLYLQLQDAAASATLDAKWTAEALCNIVDNAIKYTDQGGITISVIPYEMFVRIDISDSGIGISEEEQAKIFLRFYRSENVKEKDGVGIGLYLAREIISGEGGYIKVTSNFNAGTTFSVFLPV